jgi:glycerol-3-phosphate dehydrogenase
VHLDDVLARRTRIRIGVRDRGAEAAPHAAALMAAELGWDDDRTAAEVSGYLAMIAADLTAEAMPDDRSAFEAAISRPHGGLPGAGSPPTTRMPAD